MARIEEKIHENHLKIQVLREDRIQMLSTHGSLKQEITLAHRHLHQLTATASKIRQESQLQVNKVYDKSRNLELELRGIEALISEHDQVISHIRELNDSKLKLAAQFRGVNARLNDIKLKAVDVPRLKADVEAMRLELHKGRAAVEFEKKTRTANLEQYQSMERNMASMKSEIDRLREELADADKRARAASASAAASIPDTGYLGNYRAPDMVFQGAHSAHYPMHQTVVPADGTSPPLYRHPTGDPGYFDMHQNHVP